LSFIFCHPSGSWCITSVYCSSVNVSRRFIRSRIVSGSEQWARGNGDLLRLFIPRSPPPIFEVDACKMSMLLICFICNLLFYLFCALPGWERI